jgi:hypothetical protein
MDPLRSQHIRLPLPPGSSLSRRALFRVASALGIAGAVSKAMPASAAVASQPVSAAAATAAAAATGSQIPGFAGANRDAFATMLSGTPPTPPTGVRWYMDDTDYPNKTGYSNVSWPPITEEYDSPAHALVSIRPDIEMLNAGTFDASLYAFMLGAPAGPASLLTMWHECASMHLGDPNYPQEPSTFRQGLVHLQQLAAGQISGYPQPTNVKVGVVDINPSDLNDYPGYENDPYAVYSLWMAANLDWYGCDLYDNTTFNLSVYGQLNTFREYVNTLPGSVANADWPINLPECNSRVDTATGNSTVATKGPTKFRRSDFFHYAWAWLQNVGPGGHCSGLLGFWNGPGKEGSPWPPANTPAGSLDAMIAELDAENSQSSP